MPDPLERLTNLVALLLETRRSLTLDEIASELAGQYPDGISARRAAFERDKATLRSEGIPLEQEVLSGDRAGQTAYWIDRRRYELGDLDLDDDERHALQLAVATVHLGHAWGQEALWKLGGTSAASSAALAAELPSLAVLPVLFQAVSTRATVRFRYRDRERLLDPHLLLTREGFWYVVGRDHEHEEQRTYKVDRIDGDVSLGPAGAFERPAPIDPRAVFGSSPRQLDDREAEHTARVLVSTAWSPRGSGDGIQVLERRDDGSTVLAVPVTNEQAFRSWVLSLGEDALVLDPPQARALVVSWLERVVAGDPT